MVARIRDALRADLATLALDDARVAAGRSSRSSI